MHQVSPGELVIRVQEAVGGHQVDPRVVAEAGQQRLQNAGGGRLAHGHAASHPDDERHRPVRILRLTEELRRGGVQPLPGRHLRVDQPRQRQVNGPLRPRAGRAQFAEAAQARLPLG